MKSKRLLIGSFYLFCALAAYESLADTSLIDRAAGLISHVIAPRALRPVRSVPKPMTLAKVRHALQHDRGAECHRAVFASRRFISSHPDLIPLLVRVYVDRRTSHRTAALAGSVIQAIDEPLCRQSAEELVRVMQDRAMCCPTPKQLEDSPEESGLKTKHPVRINALNMLCRMNSGVVGVVPAIIDVDYSSGSDCLNEDRREFLEWIGPGQPEDADAISRLAVSSHGRVRIEAVICLRYHSGASQSVIPLLRREMNAEKSSAMRKVILASLSGLAGPGELSARIVTEALDDPNCIVRAHAAGLLGDFKTDRKAHAAMLLEAMDDFWPPVRRLAAESLGRIGLRASEILKRLQLAMGDQEPSVRLAAAVALIKLREKRSSAVALLFLENQLLDKDSSNRLAAIDAVIHVGSDARDTADSLTRMLTHPENREETVAVCAALGSIGSGASRASDSLVNLVDRGDSRLAQAACQAIGAIGPSGDEVVARLVEVMRSSRRIIAIRISAAGALMGAAPAESEAFGQAMEFLRTCAVLRPGMDHRPIELLAGVQPVSPRTAAVLRRFAEDYRDKSWAQSVSGSDRTVMLAAEGMGRSSDANCARMGLAILVWMMKTGLPEYGPNVVESLDEAFWKDDPEAVGSMKRANLGRHEYRRAAIESLGRLGQSAAPAAARLAEMIDWKDLRLVASARAALKRIGPTT